MRVRKKNFISISLSKINKKKRIKFPSAPKKSFGMHARIERKQKEKIKEKKIIFNCCGILIMTHDGILLYINRQNYQEFSFHFMTYS